MAGLGYLIYRRVRPPIGLPMGFVLMYGAFAGYSQELILAAAGFFLVHLFGDLYNDYHDYGEDIKNGREDKITTAGFLSPMQVRNLSFLFLSLSLLLLLFSGPLMLSVGLYYALLLVAYSHPGIRLKGGIRGYAAFSSVFVVMPVSFLFAFPQGIMLSALFSAFCFTQAMYILCQKDSTDTKDRKNLFLGHGLRRSSIVVASFGSLSSLSLLLICLQVPVLLPVWALNLASKALNINGIRKGTITRRTRGRLVLLEFVTPYLFSGGVLIA